MDFLFERFLAEKAVDSIIDEWSIEEKPCDFEALVDAFIDKLSDSPIKFSNTQYSNRWFDE